MRQSLFCVREERAMMCGLAVPTGRLRKSGTLFFNLALFLLVTAAFLTAVAQPASAQQTLFTSQTPALTGLDDNVSYELGMKFQASVGGQITAIRYWKDGQESGTHVGNIWSSTGVLLASATFTNESASGWQQQNLTSPLNINGGTTYVVSVNINSHYVATQGPSNCYPCGGSTLGLYFPISNGALVSIADDHNGVFGSPGAFPAQTFQFNNYFRDVVFTPGVANPPQAAGCLEKLVSVDGGSSFSAFTNLSNPAVAEAGVPVQFKFVVTNCGNVTVNPGTVDDTINADPNAVPFASAPPSAGGLGAPGLVLYEPAVPTPSAVPIAPGASVTYSASELPNLLVSASQMTTLCQTALQLTGKSIVRNDVQFDGSDANGNAVSYEADAYVMCPSTTTITASCVVIHAVEGVPITPVTMTASGGVGGPYTFSASGLPPGVTMSSNGTVSGTPTASGTFNYTVTITDSAGNTGTVNCSVTVAPTPPSITASCVVINAVEGTPITPVTMTASGGVGGPYTFTATGLPPGVTMSSSGTISGTPTASGTFNYTVTITDSAGNTGTVNCSVTVSPRPSCLIPPTSEIISNTSWNKFNVPAGTSPVVWVHAQFTKMTGIPATSTSSVLFSNVSFVLNGHVYPMPNGQVIFNPAAPAVSTTVFSGGTWTTTINPNFIGSENFFVGAAIPVDANISGGGQATIQFTTNSSVNPISFQWQWSAAVFTFWPTDWNQAGIQPYQGNGLHADTPTNTQVQHSLIQGPRGGGGSNYTGSWSATGQSGPCQ